MKSICSLILALVLLGGCVTMNARWDACEKNAGTFVQVAECTVKAVQADAAGAIQPTLRMRSEARAKRYSVKADELSEKVATGRMAEQDARIELRQALDQLLDEERDDRLSPLRQPQRTGVTCSPVGTSVSCTPN
jgi:hypothetical protein